MALTSTTAAIGQDQIQPANDPPLRILVVEDDPFMLTILNKRLKKAGYTVEVATNGREGLEKMGAFHPEVIISDWMMPEMDGRELCARVKEHPDGRSIYFILLTAKDKNEDKVAALDTGADEYLVKPCDGSELMARVRAAQRVVRLQEELTNRNRELQSVMTRINNELEITSQIQRSMLPQELPDIAGYRFAAHYQPSTECSGDFYDAIELAPDKLALVIGDVSGHGTPAMVAMVLSNMLLNMEVSQFENPAALLHNVNNKMWQYLPTGQYVTLFFALLNPATGQLVYSSAGHNPPLLVNRSNGDCQYLAGCEGFPIKLIGPDIEYENREMELPPDHNLILYTDGLVEAFNAESEQFGTDRLGQLAVSIREQPPEQMISSIMSRLLEFTPSPHLDDDLSLLIMNRQ